MESIFPVGLMSARAVTSTRTQPGPRRARRSVYDQSRRTSVALSRTVTGHSRSKAAERRSFNAMAVVYERDAFQSRADEGSSDACASPLRRHRSMVAYTTDQWIHRSAQWTVSSGKAESSWLYAIYNDAHGPIPDRWKTGLREAQPASEVRPPSSVAQTGVTHSGFEKGIFVKCFQL